MINIKNAIKNLFKNTAIAMATLLLIYFASGYLTKDTTTITISKTERINDKYLIFTDKGVYANVDDVRFLKFNSSDLYGKLSSLINKPIIVEVVGFRIPFLSIYKNIIKIDQKGD